MKYVRIHIITLCLLIACLSQAQSGNSTLNKAITFHADSIMKSDLLDSLSGIYDIHFSYNPELIDAHNNVSVDLFNQPLYLALKKIVDHEIVDFKALDNQVIFFPVQPKESAAIVSAYKTIRGSVIDTKKGEPIPYCNIGIFGKAMGTMSNVNGDFVVKIPEEYISDTLIFSCMGYEAQYLPVLGFDDGYEQITLKKKTYRLKSIDVVKYDPNLVLSLIRKNMGKNYDNDYSLFTTFYREMVQENEAYTDVSEAVLQVMKAPYSNDFKKDHVKFLKGRKGTVGESNSDIKFKLKGGPYYITKIDIVKNRESFINPEFRHLYTYDFDGITLIDDRQAAIITFEPIANLRDILFKGKIYVDVETWAISRIDFRYTRQSLKETRHTLIQKEPKGCRATPTHLGFTVQYKLVDEKWYLFSAMSSMNVKIVNRKKKIKTHFKSTAEILVTNIEKGNFKHFTRQEIFRSNEIFTDKIVTYDKLFWQNYNIIRPEQRLVNALKSFDNQNLVITNVGQSKN